jgi:hypothetical protein
MNISEVKDFETQTEYCFAQKCQKCKVLLECDKLFRELKKERHAPQIYIEQKLALLALIIQYNRKQKLSHLLNDP